MLAEVHLTHKSCSVHGGSCRGHFQERFPQLFPTGAVTNAIPMQGTHMGWVRGRAFCSFVFPLNPIYFLEVKVMKSQQHCYAQTNLCEAALG